MEKALVIRENDPPAKLSEQAKQYVRKSRASNTLRTYATALREFIHYAGDLPASVETIAGYLADLANAGQRVATIEVKLAAIAYGHRVAELPDPTTDEAIKSVMAGIRRNLGCRPAKKEPAMLETIQVMIDTLDLETIKGRRDKALLLVGFAGAFRRSELVALDVTDLKRGDVLRITVRRSKTDQIGEGKIKTIPVVGGDLCPVAALYAWLESADIASGPVFRRVDRHGNVYDRLTAQSVALVVKATARAAGLDWRSFSGHSLRSGFITESVNAGANNADIIEQTGQTIQTMLDYRKDTGVGATRAVMAAFGQTEE